jgi:hypothetical protein
VSTTLVTILVDSFKDTAIKNAVINMATSGTYGNTGLVSSKIEKVTFTGDVVYTGIDYAAAMPTVKDVVYDSVVRIGGYVDFSGLTKLETLTVSKTMDGLCNSPNFPVTETFKNLVLIDADQDNDSNVFVGLPVTVKNVIIGTQPEANNFAAITVGVASGGAATQLFNSAVNYIKFTGAISAAWSTFEGLTDVTIEIEKAGPTAGTIPNDTFYNNNTVVVKLGKGVTNLGNNNFLPTTATELKEYVVDSGNTAFGNNLGDGVLYGKKDGALNSLIRYPPKKTAPEGKYVIDSNVETIKGGAFGTNANLVELTIPESVKVIEASAFNSLPATFLTVNYNAKNASTDTNCFPTTLKNLNIGNAVTAIPTPFLGANTVLTTVTIPENVVTIGATSFTQCQALTEVKFNAISLRTTGAFANIVNLTPAATITSIILGDKVEIIPVSTFEGAAITGVVFKPALKSIGDRAFFGCKKLDLVDLPDTLDAIGNLTFRECDFLTTVFIRKTGMNMGTTPFNTQTGTDANLDVVYRVNGAGKYSIGTRDALATTEWIFTKFQ